MNEITNQNWVVVTKSLGKLYVNKQRANNLVSLLNSDKKPQMIKIDLVFVSAFDITAISPANIVEDAEKEKSGKWKCNSDNWHEKFEQCKCGWGMDTSSTKSLEKETISEEKLERGKIMRQLIDQGHKMSELINLKSKSNEELTKLLSDKMI